MSLDLDDLGSVVFEELACWYLGYNSFLVETTVLYHYQKDDKSIVAILINEVGKQPYKVKFETTIIKSEIVKWHVMNFMKSIKM